MKNIKIISLADSEYYHFLFALTRSAEEYFPQASLHLTLVNMDECKIEELRKGNNNITVEIENVNFSKEYEKRCYCARRRGFLFYKLRDICDDILLWIDADSVIRKNCDDLHVLLNKGDLSVVQRRKATDIRSGIIGINTTPVCREFINRYKSILDFDHTWMSDQQNLNKLYREMEKKINLNLLPDVYCDVWFREEGIIWEAKSKSKNSKRYRIEIEKYLQCLKTI